MKYLIVLFKDKNRKKIINKFKTFERAKNFFDRKISENKVTFNKLIENGKSCSFELGILEKGSNNFDLYFVRDNLGRQVKVSLDDPDYRIIEVQDYFIEELIFDISKNTKISFNSFVKVYLPKTGIKLISKINHKIVVQNDDDVYLFSLKSESDCLRFLRTLEGYMCDNNRMDCIIVSDSSKEQKKYLYNLLESKGISKKVLYRRSTTFFTGE
jgi:hypothetical protein